MFVLHKVVGVSTLIFTVVSSQYISFGSSALNARLNSSSQTLASLIPQALTTFDFSPFDVLSQRSQNGNYHVGDITLRYRAVGDSSWTSVDSAAERAAVTSTGVTSANLAPTLPSGIPLSITRAWSISGADINLNFTITNQGTSSIEIGALGFPIEFNSIFTDRTAVDTQKMCSLVDPNIGLDGGYLRVTPLSGTGPALVVTPLGHTPLEGWRFLEEDTDTALGYQSQTFEGFYSWETYTLAYTQNEWKGTSPWNPGTSVVLAAGQSITKGLKFSAASSISDIESTVANTGTPVAIGVPGYIIPQDLTAQLFLQHTSTVSSITSTPAGAFTFSTAAKNKYTLTPSSSPWGRVRVTITYADGLVQTVNYVITQSAPGAISSLGTFLTSNQWLESSSDPFGRGPSVISYDRSVNAQVLQDPRVWIAGLSDEAGAGSWLAATMKQAISPNAAEITKLEQFVTKTLWGNIQNSDYSVKMSVFYYQPGAVSYSYSSSIDWGNWWSWNKNSAYGTGRTYDYVHVTAAYWALYRVARFYPKLVTKQTWQWYLNQAYETIIYATGPDTGYVDVGLMGETVWGYVLQDLQNEGNKTAANAVIAAMKTRANLWNSEAVPYGSEMAWDSTGQEGVYYWSNYFGLTTTVTKTINSILGYMPAVSHWAWNGNARRYWDFIYGGKLMRFERMGHHYGSGLNALPLLSHFEQNPTETYLLRVGYGGTNGPLSNIDSEGFASAAFHTWPDTMAWDAYSGDYGPNFVGLALGSGTYVVDDTTLGLIAFGGALTGSSTSWAVAPKDAVRRKVFIAQLGFKFEIDAGAIASVTYTNGTVKLTIAPIVSTVSTMASASSTILRVTKTAQVGSVGKATVSELGALRGGWAVDLTGGEVVVSITFS
ncbi:hypothetical protein SS1G_06426 [Sclerotinia sclerotiorum 1980 UF-70]|uniref:Glycoside hydrolase family 43 protein n=2 Tax=Sclerotinia sclerotiorum (strain ATCC 18683 / 1980 / Ss-1) TaxID=665079 RepID=A7EM79_SCLS1|nr:hypothetical protein SS1G_06426 [Sclerotinia sclerotiorum 1980 UF-70]APA14501.1 hypothetical protein sscle_13g092710 [Sclerotinia sclerotiorum 1980 UF-70]EDO03945.1 hypothetical protein SS1G_06426 [Sclerotinia sclerotiorum 1980 UF-70]